MNTTLNPAHLLLLSTKPFQFLKTNHPNPQANTNPPPFPSTPLPHLTLRPPTHSNSLFGRVNSLLPRSHSSSSSPSQPQFVLEILVLFAFSLALLCLRLFSAVLLPEFPRRWQGLVAFAPEVEARTSAYPPHVWQAVVAYEDRRFFRHFGIDPVGIARAVVSFSALGGGSTITQQVNFCWTLNAQHVFDVFTQRNIFSVFFNSFFISYNKHILIFRCKNDVFIVYHYYVVIMSLLCLRYIIICHRYVIVVSSDI